MLVLQAVMLVVCCFYSYALVSRRWHLDGNIGNRRLFDEKAHKPMSPMRLPLMRPSRSELHETPLLTTF